MGLTAAQFTPLVARDGEGGQPASRELFGQPGPGRELLATALVGERHGEFLNARIVPDQHDRDGVCRQLPQTLEKLVTVGPVDLLLQVDDDVRIQERKQAVKRLPGSCRGGTEDFFRLNPHRAQVTSKRGCRPLAARGKRSIAVTEMRVAPTRFGVAKQVQTLHVLLLSKGPSPAILSYDRAVTTPRRDEAGADFGPAKIDVDRDEKVTFTWSEGKVVAFDLVELRANCPCAECRERRKAGQPVWPPSGSRQPLRILDARLVGAFGIGFEWSDGHGTGIYTWDTLRRWSDEKEAD